MKKMEKKKRLEDKVTHVYLLVCDDGCYGASYCGHCDYELDDKKSYDSCPKCKYKFKGSEVSPSFGGSDF